MEFGTGARSDFWQLVMGKSDDSALYSREDDAVAIRVEPDPWAKRDGGGDDLMRCVAWGEPNVAIDELLKARGEFGPFNRMMIGTEIYEAMTDEQRDQLAPHWGHGWDLYWADEKFADVGRSADVELYRSGTPEYEVNFDEIREALKASNPITSALKHMDDYDWFILRNESGEIVTIMGATFDKYAHFAGLGTVPEHRGKGYGGATMIGAINIALDICEMVQFGVWSWNEGALRLYDRLRITRSGAVISGRHEPFEDLESQA